MSLGQALSLDGFDSRENIFIVVIVVSDLPKFVLAKSGWDTIA
jgi:hypothetical protein